MALTKEQLQNIDEQFDATRSIVKSLAPLTERAQRRLLNYFADLATDPEVDWTQRETNILNKVSETLGVVNR